MPAQVLELIRSISFSSLVVGFLLYLAFARHPTLFPPGTTTKEVVFIGAAVGTIVHRALHAAIFNPLTKSVAISFAFYAKVLELGLNHQAGILTEEEYRLFSAQRKAQYFGVSETPIVIQGQRPAASSLAGDKLEQSNLEEENSRSAVHDSVPKQLESSRAEKIRKRRAKKPADVPTAERDSLP